MRCFPFKHVLRPRQTVGTPVQGTSGVILLAGLMLLLLPACSDLDPLGAEDGGPGVLPSEDVRLTLDLESASPVSDAPDGIDGGFLTPDIPVTVSIGFEGTQPRTHRVLTSAFLRLETDDSWVFSAVASNFLITAGIDEGPSEVCMVTERGVFEQDDVTISLFTPNPDGNGVVRDSTGSAIRHMLVRDAEDRFRMASLKVGCKRTEGSRMLETSLVLSGLQFRRR